MLDEQNGIAYNPTGSPSCSYIYLFQGTEEGDPLQPEPRLRLVEARKHRQWSQHEVASRLGTTQHNVSRWERGETVPGPYFRAKLCDLFGKTPQELGLGEHTQQSPNASVEANADPAPAQAPSPEEASPLWAVPYPRNPFFTGRDSFLEDLHQRLTHEHRAALSQSTVLSGLGGIGKTAVAIEYAYRHAHDYTALFWVGAETAERLVSSFVTLAEILQVPERLDSDQQRVVNAVQRWLATHQDWLLIFDNVEDLEIVRPFVPTVPHGSILFTTRLQAVGTLASLVPVETMGLAEGTLFLLRRAKLLPAEASLDQVSPELLAEAEALVVELDFLPLALDQAGAYIEEVGCTPAAYLKLYLRHRKALLQRRGQATSSHPKSVATTWSLSFQRIEQKNPEAADLLRMCAFLEPDSIPEELLQEGYLAAYSSLMGAAATDLLSFHAACEDLARFSLVQRDPQARLLRIHRLVQAVLTDAMETRDQERWVECMLRATERLFPATGDASTWSQCQRLLPQAQMGSVLVERFAVASGEAASLLHRTAHYLREVALYEQAKHVSQQVLAIHERMLKHEHLETAQALHALAEVDQKQGVYAEAEPLYQQALSIQEQHLGPEHPDVAQTLNGLANLYREQGRYAEAEVLYQRALAIREQQLGSEHLDTATSLNDLAIFYRYLGKYEQVELLYQRALTIREQQLGSEHPLTAQILHNLAALYQYQGKYIQAEPLLQQALKIRECLLGAEHPDTAMTLNNLAGLYWNQGKYEQAESLYQRALTIQERHLGTEHPDTATCLNDLANLYRDQGWCEQAEPLYQRALMIYEQQLGTEHPFTASALNNLATIYRDQGKYEQAEPLYLRALAIREHQLKTEHPLTASSLNNLASLYREQGKYEQAEPLYQRALAIRERRLGLEHPNTADTLYGLAVLQEAQENFSQAASFYHRALVIRERVLGSDHQKTREVRTKYMKLLGAKSYPEKMVGGERAQGG